jgi:hypothetical protein
LDSPRLTDKLFGDQQFQACTTKKTMLRKDYVGELRIQGDADLQSRLIDTFSKLRQQEGIKHADIVTRLKEQMESALNTSTNASD